MLESSVKVSLFGEVTEHDFEKDDEMNDACVYFVGNYPIETLLECLTNVIGRPFTHDQAWRDNYSKDLYRNFFGGIFVYCTKNTDGDEANLPLSQYDYIIVLSSDPYAHVRGMEYCEYMNYAANVLGHFCAFHLDTKACVYDTNAKITFYDYTEDVPKKE